MNLTCTSCRWTKCSTLRGGAQVARVIAAEGEPLTRLSLRELLQRLDPGVFWQVHRSTVVQARCITSAQREDSGIVRLRLRGHKDVLTASRLYAHLFRGM